MGEERPRNFALRIGVFFKEQSSLGVWWLENLRETEDCQEFVDCFNSGNCKIRIAGTDDPEKLRFDFQYPDGQAIACLSADATLPVIKDVFDVTPPCVFSRAAGYVAEAGDSIEGLPIFTITKK